jgi:hypothetical protein
MPDTRSLYCPFCRCAREIGVVDKVSFFGAPYFVATCDECSACGPRGDSAEAAYGAWCAPVVPTGPSVNARATDAITTAVRQFSGIQLLSEDVSGFHEQLRLRGLAIVEVAHA